MGRRGGCLLQQACVRRPPRRGRVLLRDRCLSTCAARRLIGKQVHFIDSTSPQKQGVSQSLGNASMRRCTKRCLPWFATPTLHPSNSTSACSTKVCSMPCTPPQRRRRRSVDGCGVGAATAATGVRGEGWAGARTCMLASQPSNPCARHACSMRTAPREQRFPWVGHKGQQARLWGRGHEGKVGAERR